MSYSSVKCYTWDKNIFHSLAFALFTYIINILKKYIYFPLFSVIFCSFKIGSIWCNRSFDEAHGKCLNLAPPDLKVLLNSDLIPVLKLIMLSPRIAVLLVWVILVFTLTAFLYDFSPGTVHFFWKLCWFIRNLIRTTSGLFDC